MEYYDLDWNDVQQRAYKVTKRILTWRASHNIQSVAMYPIPRGGVYAALHILRCEGSAGFYITDDIAKANVIIDDLLDTGTTAKRYTAKAVLEQRIEFPQPLPPVFFLVDKQQENITSWVRYPWERLNKDETIEDNVTRLIEFIGEDPTREGLIGTPNRVAKAYKDLFSGYDQKLEDLITVFEDGTCDEMVVLRRLEFHSCCEHHMLPFSGVAHIGYIPNKKVIGVSKLARILEVFTRRLQIQERIGEQVTDALNANLQPLGSACVLEAKHHCMMCRGVEKQGAEMVTSSLTGAMRDDPQARAEFLQFIR